LKYPKIFVKRNNIYSDIEKKKNEDAESKKFKHEQNFCYFIYICTYVSYMHAGI